MTKSVCDELFKKDVTWVLGTIPCNGLYANLLGYQKSHYPSLTNREVGTLLSKIDPHLAATVHTRRPENVFKKNPPNFLEEERHGYIGDLYTKKRTK